MVPHEKVESVTRHQHLDTPGDKKKPARQSQALFAGCFPSGWSSGGGHGRFRGGRHGNRGVAATGTRSGGRDIGRGGVAGGGSGNSKTCGNDDNDDNDGQKPNVPSVRGTYEESAQGV